MIITATKIIMLKTKNKVDRLSEMHTAMFYAHERDEVQARAPACQSVGTESRKLGLTSRRSESEDDGLRAMVRSQLGNTTASFSNYRLLYRSVCRSQIQADLDFNSIRIAKHCPSMNGDAVLPDGN